MNHYERLKVTPDAPPEVIRAAYRALATKCHPDRQGGDAGPSEDAHEQMAALNASYLVLTDAATRAAYDAQLRESRAEALARATAGARATASAPPPVSPGRERQGKAKHPEIDDSDNDAGNTRVDIDWLNEISSVGKPWIKQPRWMVALGLSGLIAVGGLYWMWQQESSRISFDRSLAQSNIGKPGVPPGAAPAADTHTHDATNAAANAAIEETMRELARAGVEAPHMAPSGALIPSSEQLASMSNEELLANMPKLLNDDPVVKAVMQSTLPMPEKAEHPLDGMPLGLKLDLTRFSPGR